MEGIFSGQKRGGHSPSSTSEVLLSKSRWGFVHNEPKWGGSRGADANLTPSLQYATPFRHRGQQLWHMNKIVPFNNICHDFLLSVCLGGASDPCFHIKKIFQVKRYPRRTQKWKSIAAADNKKVSDARTDPRRYKNQYCPSLFNKQAAKT
jgi:hypothetical protein